MHLCCCGYTIWVYQWHCLIPANQGGPWRWYGGYPTGRPSCWWYGRLKAAMPWRIPCCHPMADSQTHQCHGRFPDSRSSWQISQDMLMADLPYSTRYCIGLSLGLYVVSAPEPPWCPRQTPL
jgi:hypothetical protein